MIQWLHVVGFFLCMLSIVAVKVELRSKAYALIKAERAFKDLSEQNRAQRLALAQSLSPQGFSQVTLGRLNLEEIRPDQIIYLGTSQN